MRYVVEKVAKQPTMRRVKDTVKGKYVKQPHGADLWTAEAAQAKANSLNVAQESQAIQSKAVDVA